MRRAALFFLLVTVTTGLAQDWELTLIVYNKNLALVKDVRSLDLAPGTSRVKIEDIPAQIEPASLHFASLTAPQQVRTVEQNFAYDLATPGSLLARYVGKSVTLQTKGGKAYSGTLVSASGKEVVLAGEGGGIKIVDRASIQDIELPHLPEGVVTRPTLFWTVACKKPGKHRVEIDYLTAGVEWQAEYTAFINAEETALELAAWAAVENNSGATYRGARLRLMAGEIHRAQQFRPYPLTKRTAFAEAAQAPAEETPVFEYHLYTIEGTTTLENHQTKQLALFPAVQVKAVKKYTYDASKSARNVAVTYEFKNKGVTGSDVPLPGGRVRVYKKGEQGLPIFLGEDLLSPTPQGGEVRLHVGDAFDVKGERVQKARRSLGKKGWEETWQVKLRNHKQEDVRVSVVEHLNPNWKIVRASHDYTQRDARTIEFRVMVPRGGETVIDYQVEYVR